MSTKDFSTTDSSVSDRPPAEGQRVSFMVVETGTMERKRRRGEQDGHRKRAKVNEREHREEVPTLAGQEFEQQAGNLQHPALNTPQYDGIDPNLNPDRTTNPQSPADIENALREQEMEKQHRLGLLPKMGTAPRPDKP